jgi:hypothetical protein
VAVVYRPREKRMVVDVPRSTDPALPTAVASAQTPNGAPVVPAPHWVSTPPASLRPASLAFMGWAVVASALLLRLALLRARVLNALGDRTPVVDPMVRARLLGLCQDVHHTREVRLTTSAGLRSPVALGWGRSVSPPRRSSSSMAPSSEASSPMSWPTSGASTRCGWSSGRCWSSCSSSSR